MDILNLGGGAATGFIASALTLLGWNRRLNRLEEIKQDIHVCHETHDQEKAAMSKMQDDIAYIRSRVDRLIDLKLNGR